MHAAFPESDWRKTQVCIVSPSRLPKGMDYKQKAGFKSEWDGIVSLSADYSTEDRLTRKSWSTASLRGKCTTTKGLGAVWGRTTSKRTDSGEVKEPVPWVMWWACLPSDDEFDGVPAALAVLHQDRHRILPTRQRAGQWLARSLRHPHLFHTTTLTNSPQAFSWRLVDSWEHKNIRAVKLMR